jgi:hypothetical protein
MGGFVFSERFGGGESVWGPILFFKKTNRMVLRRSCGNVGELSHRSRMVTSMRPAFFHARTGLIGIGFVGGS